MAERQKVRKANTPSALDKLIEKHQGNQSTNAKQVQPTPSANAVDVVKHYTNAEVAEEHEKASKLREKHEELRFHELESALVYYNQIQENLTQLTVTRQRNIKSQEAAIDEQLNLEKAAARDKESVARAVPQNMTASVFIAAAIALVSFFLFRDGLGLWGIVALVIAFFVWGISLGIVEQIKKANIDSEREQYTQTKIVEAERKAQQSRIRLQSDRVSYETYIDEATALYDEINENKKYLLISAHTHQGIIKQIVTSILEKMEAQFEVTNDALNKEAEGKPIIQWHRPLLKEQKWKKAFSSLTTNVDNWGAVKVKVRLYSQVGGVKKTQGFMDTCKLLFEDDVTAEEVKITDYEAEPNKSIHYYLVALVEFENFKQDDAGFKQVTQSEEFLEHHELVRVKPFVNKHMLAEETISEGQSELRMRKFEEKFQREMGTNTYAADPTKGADSIIDAMSQHKKHKDAAEQAVQRIRDQGQEMGLTEEEIEEFIEEYESKLNE